MRFSFVNEYNQEAMAAMARALRRTVRAKHNRRTHVFGWIAAALAVLLAFWTREGGFGFAFGPRFVVTIAAAVLLAAVLIGEDSLNGYIAFKRLPPGTGRAEVVFDENGFTSTTELGVSAFRYDRILALAEDDKYFIFVYSESHAQIYDKRTIAGGTPEEFRAFMEGMTGKQVLKV